MPSEADVVPGDRGGLSRTDDVRNEHRPRQVSVECRFIGTLADLLVPERRSPVVSQVAAGTTVKDFIESLRVPHTEVDVVVVGGRSVDFEYQLGDGDVVVAYPVGTTPDLVQLQHLQPGGFDEARFVLDVHLGRLARYLRLLGFDATWSKQASDAELVDIACAEQRILLSRDRGVLQRKKVTRGYFVRETERTRQAIEVLRRFGLFGAVRPFGRCLKCNTRLEHVEKKDVEADLPPRIRRDFDDFERCPGCGRVYWQGSHYDALVRVIAMLVQAGSAESRSPP